MFAPLVNNPDETKCIADAAADLVGEANVDRNRSLITAAEESIGLKMTHSGYSKSSTMDTMFRLDHHARRAT